MLMLTQVVCLPAIGTSREVIRMVLFEPNTRSFLRHRATVTTTASVLLIGAITGAGYAFYQGGSWLWGKVQRSPDPPSS